MTISPTPRMLDLLRFIAGYQEAFAGVSPSYAECRRAMGLISNGCVNRMLRALAERGLIRRELGAERSIELLTKPTIPRAPDGAPLYFVRTP